MILLSFPCCKFGQLLLNAIKPSLRISPGEAEGRPCYKDPPPSSSPQLALQRPAGAVRKLSEKAREFIDPCQCGHFKAPFSSVLPVLCFPSDLPLCSWSFGCREQSAPAWQAQRLNGIWASPSLQFL